MTKMCSVSQTLRLALTALVATTSLGCLSAEDLSTVPTEKLSDSDAGQDGLIEPDGWYDQIENVINPRYRTHTEPHPARTPCGSDDACRTPAGPSPDVNANWGVCAPDFSCLRRCEQFGACAVAVTSRPIAKMVGDADAVYWTTRAGQERFGPPAEPAQVFRPATDVEIWRQLPGMAPTRLAMGRGDVLDLAEHGPFLYWSESGGKLYRMAKSGGDAQFLYQFDGCHHVGFGPDHLVAISSAGVTVGALDGSLAMRKVGDTSSQPPLQICEDAPMVVGEEIFHRYDRTLVATNLQTGQRRHLVSDFSRLGAADGRYIYEFDLVGRGAQSWGFSKHDLVSGLVVLAAGKGYDQLPQTTFEAQIHDGYAYVFASNPGSDRPGWYTAHRFTVDGERAALSQNIIPIDFQPGGVPARVTAQVVSAHGLYFAASLGSGSVVYRTALPAAP